MSILALNWAFAQKLPPARQNVLSALAHRHHGQTGRCDPSVETLAAMTGLSANGVRNSLKDLRARGLIEIETRRKGRRQGTNAYKLNLQADTHLTAGAAGSKLAFQTAEARGLKERLQPAAPEDDREDPTSDVATNGYVGVFPSQGEETFRESSLRCRGAW